MRTRYEWIGLGMLLSSAALALLSSARYSQASSARDERERLALVGGMVGARMEADLGAIDRALKGVIGDYLERPQVVPADVSRRLHALSDAMPVLRSLVVLDGRGRALAANHPGLLGQDFSARAYFQAAQADRNPGALHVSAPSRSLRGDLVIAVARRLNGPGGRMQALVVATLGPDYFSAMLQPVLYAADMRAAVLHDRHVWLQLPAAAAAPARLLVARTVQPAGVRMDQPLQIELSRELAALDAPQRRALHTSLVVLGALAMLAGLTLYWSQSRRRQFSALAAMRVHERRAAALELERVLGMAEIGAWQWHAAGIDIDRNCAALLGVAPGAASAAEWQARVHPDEGAARSAALAACRVPGSPPYDLRYRYRHPDGQWRWLRERGQAAPAGGAGGTVMNVTASVTEQQAIAAERAELQTIFDDLGEAVVLFDASGAVVRANRAGRTLHGLFADGDALSAAGSADLALCSAHGTALAPSQWPSRRALRGQFVHDLELQVRRRSSGAAIVAEFSTAALRDSSGASGFVATCRDVSERHRADALRASEARFRTLIEQAPLPVAILRHGHFLYTNPRYRVLHGYAADDDLDGLPWRAMLAPAWHDTLARQEALIAADAANDLTFEALGLCKNGALVPVLKTTAQVSLSDGPATLVFVQDISCQKRAEAAMVLAREAAEAANHGKAEFLANMSHEIRSPLNALLGLAYLLEQTCLPGDALEMVQRIRASGATLLGIVSDILDVSKIDAGHMQIEQAPFRLDQLVDRIADSMGVAAAGKRIELLIAPLPRGLALVRGDALRLEQVLLNLTSNAIKFTEAGQVVLQCSVERRQQQHLLLRFEVRDTGIGMAPQIVADMFSPFTQADSSTTRRFGGTGLGLTICRQLVELMGGAIGVHSAPGAGSVFFFTLPCEDLGEPEAPRLDGPALQLLIADDSALGLDALAGLAERLGWQAHTVDSGQAALDWLAHCAAPARPQVVVLDWKMQGLDGLATARAMHAMLGQADCPVILMATAHSLSALAAAPDAELVDVVLAKPVTATALQRAVQKACARRASAGMAGVAPVTEQSLDGVCVLVVDDNDINRSVTGRILGRHGARCHYSADGQAALDWLACHAEAPDLVLMDVQMPRMDGLEATRRLRAQPRFAALPIIALSAGAFRSQQEQALAAGMNHFVSKPFDVPAMVALVARTARTARAGSALDLPQALAIWGELASYRAFLAVFQDDYGAVVEQLEQAAPEPARALAHRLAGVAGNLGLPATMAAASTLEQTLACGADAAAALAALAQALAQVWPAIAALERQAAEGVPHGAP